MGKETDPGTGNSIVISSAMISPKELVALAGIMELPFPAWNQFYHLFDLVRTGTSIGGQLLTY
jgi:hypothetical protein